MLSKFVICEEPRIETLLFNKYSDVNDILIDRNPKRRDFYLRPGLRQKEREKAAAKKLKKLARKMR